MRRVPCKKGGGEVGKKRGKKIAEKMHIAISGGKPTIPIFQYSDFRMSYVSFYLASGLGQILISYSLFFDIFFLNVDRSK